MRADPGARWRPRTSGAQFTRIIGADGTDHVRSTAVHAERPVSRETCCALDKPRLPA